MRTALRSIVESTDTLAGKFFDIGVTLLIIASMVTFAIETIPTLSESSRLWLGRFEILTVVLFIAEYLLRLYVAERPIGYATSFYGVVDLMAAAPALFSMGLDTRPIRMLRLLRLLRLLKLTRYNRAIQRLHVALQLAWEELILFFVVSLILLFIAAAGIYQFENEVQPKEFSSFFHSLWWAVTTLSTVGYGDVYPITVGGRIFTFMVLFVGIGVVAMPSGLIASALTQARELENQDRPPAADKV